MANNLNKVQFIGNLGRDPEMRFTPNGKAVTNISVAVNRVWTGQDGQKQKITTWYRVNTWDKRAETINNQLSKGDQVYVEGRLEVDPATGGPKIFTKQDGTASASFEVRAFDVHFLKVAKWENGNGAQAQNQNFQPAPTPNGFPTNYGQQPAQGQQPVQGQQPIPQQQAPVPQGQQPMPQGQPPAYPQQQPQQQQGQGW